MVTWPSRATTTYSWTHQAYPVTETLHLGDGTPASQRRNLFNGLGLPRQTQTLVEDEDADPANPRYDITDTRYDSSGRAIAQSSPHRLTETAAWTELSRDALGRITRVKGPDGSETHTFYDEAALPDTVAAVDPRVIGNTTRMVDPWGRERWTWHNGLGQLQWVVDPDPDGDGSVLSGGTHATTYVYDPLGQVVMLTERSPSALPANRVFRYDGLGRLTHQALLERDGTLTDAGVYRGPQSGRKWSDVFSYADGSRLAWHVDARGVRTRFDYGDDPLGRLQSISYELSPPPIGTPVPAVVEPASNVSYTYVDTGDVTRLASVTTDEMAKGYTYDDQGRLASVSLIFSDRPRAPFVLDYEYDDLDRITAMRYPARYGFPGNPRRRVTQSYGAPGRILELTVDGVAHLADVFYSPFGWATSLTVGRRGPRPSPS